MLNLGLTSVTFRAFGYTEVIEYCKACGLTCIEWGSDVHVPQTDPENARAVKAACDSAGISVCSYGSYYTLCSYDNYEEVFQDYLDTAVILGAPLIRLWAGNLSYDKADTAYYERAVEETRRICDMAIEHGVMLAFEFHNGTLCDTGEHALQLFWDISKDNFGMYYQYDLLVSLEENYASLDKMLPYLNMVHVGFCTRDFKRLYVDEENAKEYWTTVVSRLQKNGLKLNLLFEFLKDTSLDGLRHQTCAMRSILSGTQKSCNVIP